MAEESAERRAEARLIAESWAKDFPKARLVQWEKDVQKLARAYLDLAEALRLAEQRAAALLDIAERDAATIARSLATNGRLLEREAALREKWKLDVAAAHAASNEHPPNTPDFEYHRGFAHGVVRALNDLAAQQPDEKNVDQALEPYDIDDAEPDE